MIKEKAYAKINLFLDVCSKRNDGFHDIKTVMQSISLCDELFFLASESEKTEINVVTHGANLPSDNTNLVYRALEEYLKTAHINATVSVEVNKNIPVSAGLGGGSADAAATLRAMNRIFSALDFGQMNECALRLGSDVPFCLIGGTAICEGRGEKIEPLSVSLNDYLVVAIGADRVSTPEAYARLDAVYSDFDGSVIRDTTGFFDTLTDSLSHSVLPYELYNIFETNIDDFAESVTKIKAELKKHGAYTTLMSGSGPSVFGVFKVFEQADSARLALSNLGYTAYVSSFS